jgi:hypothetical protein
LTVYQLNVSQKSGGASNCSRVVLSSEAVSHRLSGVISPNRPSSSASGSTPQLPQHAPVEPSI